MSKKKKTDKNIRGKVLSIFKKNPSKIFNYKQIAAKLNIKDTQKRNSVIKVLGQLSAQKIINQAETGKFSLLADKENYLEGVIEMTASGNGYLLQGEDEQDVFISRDNINRSLDGDRVLVNLIKRRNNGKKNGEVIEIKKRATQNYIGVFERKKDFGFVNTRALNMFTDFFIEKEEMKNFEDGKRKEPKNNALKTLRRREVFLCLDNEI